MREAHAVQLAIGGDHIFEYPCAISPFAWSSTSAHYLLEGGIKTYFMVAIAQRFAQ
jgi:hypothetical protein